MARAVPYKYGDPVTQDEFLAVRARIAPTLSRRGKRIAMNVFLQMLHNVDPMRLAHEVDRCRGLAFDSGEAGFSHSWGD